MEKQENRGAASPHIHFSGHGFALGQQVVPQPFRGSDQSRIQRGQSHGARLGVVLVQAAGLRIPFWFDLPFSCMPAARRLGAKELT